MRKKITFPGKVGLQQRVLPNYRAQFVDHLASFCLGGLSVFAGEPQKIEAIQSAESLKIAQHTSAKNITFFRGKYSLTFQRGLMEWLESWDPSVLILEANPRYITNRSAIRWMHERERPVIGWGLGATHSEGAFSGVINRYRNQYLSSYDGLIAYSSFGAEQFAEAGIPPERIHVAINSTIHPPASMPERNSIKGRAPRIVFVGRLQARKRVDLLLKACAMVETKPECWIVGDGPERPGLTTLAQEINSEAKFLGSKHGPELDELFNQADLFVLPGTGGLAIQEAMAHGLPVIVAEGDGTQRDLVSQDNGWLVTPGDLEGLSRALQEACADPDGLIKKGIASYQIVLDRASIDVMAEVFIGVMNRLSKGS